MNKTIASLFGAASALVCLSVFGQDARPSLSADPTPTETPTATPTPSPTPIPTTTAVTTTSVMDESVVATESSSAAANILATDPILAAPNAYPTPSNDNILQVDEKRPFAAQPPSPASGVTLDQVVQTALERNADILKQIAEIKRTRGQVVEVRAQAVPHLGVSSNYNQSKSLSSGQSSSSNPIVSKSESVTTTTPNQGQIGFVDPSVISNGGQPFKVFGTGTSTSETRTSTTTTSTVRNSSGSPSENKSWNVSFQVTQVIYSGGQISASLRSAHAQEDSAFYQLRDTVDQVIALVRQQFYTVLLNRALIGVQEESVTLLQSELRDQKNRYEAGTVPRFNVLRAEVELANAQPDLIRAKNAYRTAQLQLAKLVGVSWPTTSDLTPYPIKGLLTYNPQKIDLQTAVEMAKERRAFLKVQRQTIISEVEQIKVALAGYKPTINGDAGYQYRNDSASSDLSDTVDGWFFGFSGSWNIFDGLATSGRVTQARARLEAAKVNYDDSVRQVELEVQTTYSKAVEGRELIESQQKTVEQAAEALRLARERLSAGAGTQLEVLDARVSLTQAQTTALQALADYNSTLAELDRVTGAVTIYHDTFDDPLANKKSRNIWLAKMKKKKASLTDEELRNNLIKRRKAAGQ